MIRKANKKVSLLLVEDDDDHAELVSFVLNEAEITDGINRVSDGEQALSFLRQEGEYVDAPKPDLVLLDLKLPKLNGLKVLENIKSDERLRAIPVIVLSTSSSQHDQMAAYQRHANGYLVKPTDYERFGDLVRDFGAYWAKWNEYVSPSSPLAS